ncbi:MAG: IS110 family transposase [Actinomycetota bacterium]|nr:IS110 family transposase [Actinomycetota bacterium]
MARVVIGMDPHKRSATIEVCDEQERVLATGRFGTDREGYRQLLAAGRRWPERLWAVEGCQGVGRHLAQRLVADGEPVLDVPAKLSARVRVFSTGQGRKTDATDAHSVAVVALRTPGLRAVRVDDATVALRLLVDRRDELGAARTLTVNRLHRLLVELVAGGAKKFLSATQAKALLATVRPRDVVGKTRRLLAAELVGELAAIDKKIKTANAQLTELVEATGSTLLELNGIGPSGAARLLGDIGDVSRFPSRGHFASWNGTAPLDASSGEQRRHRLSRAGNRRINRVLHVMAIVQLRNDTEGRAYYRRKITAGKTTMEAMRALKRRLSDIVYTQLVNDQKRQRSVVPQEAGPGGQAGAATGSSAADFNPNVDALEKSLPGPAGADSTPAAADLPYRSSARSRRPVAAPTRSRRRARSA